MASQMASQMALQMVTAFNCLLCPCIVQFARTSKIDDTFQGILSHCTWSDNKRRGGGFVFWIFYRSEQPRTHFVVLKEMLRDYSSRVSQLQLKSIQNITPNATKDLELLIDNVAVRLGSVFPTKIRELKSVERCTAWITQLNTRLPAKALPYKWCLGNAVDY
jgi:hypothetical protein